MSNKPPIIKLEKWIRCIHENILYSSEYKNDSDLGEFMCYMHIKKDNLIEKDEFITFEKMVWFEHGVRHEQILESSGIIVDTYFNRKYDRYVKWATIFDKCDKFKDKQTKSILDRLEINITSNEKR